MKAWEFEHKLTADAVPPELHDDNEADWMAYTEAGRASDKQLSTTGTIRFRDPKRPATW